MPSDDPLVELFNLEIDIVGQSSWLDGAAGWVDEINVFIAGKMDAALRQHRADAHGRFAGLSRLETHG